MTTFAQPKCVALLNKNVFYLCPTKMCTFPQPKCEPLFHQNLYLCSTNTRKGHAHVLMGQLTCLALLNPNAHLGVTMVHTKSSKEPRLHFFYEALASLFEKKTSPKDCVDRINRKSRVSRQNLVDRIYRKSRVSRQHVWKS